MSGALWITSYAVLSFVVLILTLATIALYRIVDERAGGVDQKWPFARVKPGEPFPFSLAADSHAGFVLIGTKESDCFAAAMSLASVASSWGYPVRIQVREGSTTSWLDRLPHELRANTSELTTSDFDRLGIDAVPVTAFVRHGRLVDAEGGLHFPSLIVECFRLAAGPLGCAGGDEGRATGVHGRLPAEGRRS